MQAVDYVHLVGPVYLGCHDALLHLTDPKTSALFTHVLCVADDIEKPAGLPDTVVFHRIPIANGVQMPIGDDKLWKAVEYIRLIWREFTKRRKDRRLLIYCRYVAFRYVIHRFFRMMRLSCLCSDRPSTTY